VPTALSESQTEIPSRTDGPAPLHLLHVFPTLAIGGARTRLIAIANALPRKYRHTILAMDGNLDAASGLAPDVRRDLARIPVVNSRNFSLANVRRARGLLRRIAPDLLVTYNSDTFEWSLADWPGLVPHIHIEDGFGYDEAPLRPMGRRVWIRRLCLAGCQRVVVPSTTLVRIAIDAWHLKPERVLHLPHGVDVGRFGQPPDRALIESLGLPDGALVVGTVAALRPDKNVLRLVRVFASLPATLGARLVIVGDGPERARILAEVARLGISARVILAGGIAAPERLLGRFDVFALASDAEQMPGAVLEAMAAGLPVAATDVGDIRPMLSAGNGQFVVPTGDEGALKTALLTLLEYRDLRHGIGAANRERARTTYPLETMVARYDALFEGAARYSP
jgi:glycosyltransferase involved in cell wall biosynthesis